MGVPLNAREVVGSALDHLKNQMQTFSCSLKLLLIEFDRFF